MYSHGIKVKENPTSLPTPETGTAGLQVIVGTAPINLANDPYAATNEVILVKSLEECKQKLGYSKDFVNYTLCQSMSALFELFGVAPAVFINVLDSNKHKKDLQETSYTVVANQVTVNKTGILADKVVVKKDVATLETDTDYITSFDDNGYLVISLIDGGAGEGAETLKVSGVVIAPELVTETDVIGGYDASTGLESGLELIRHVYPQTGYTPALLIAPGWSHKTNVATIMVAKCTEINGCFNCETLIDLDCSSSGAVKYTDVKNAKENILAESAHAALLWPKTMVGDTIYYYSSIFATSMSIADIQNDDVPNLRVSNKKLPITATCLEDGREILLDQEQANELNAIGVITAINMNGFRSWGNNSSAYPGTKDPKDRWFGCRRFFSWWGNRFISDNIDEVDNPNNYRLMESLCDNENLLGSSYVSSGKCAGIKIKYNKEDNTVDDLVDGKVRFRQYLAPYTPAEDILNILEFDPNLLKSSLAEEGSEE